MGYITAKDRNMNGYKVSTVSSVKQGYLHIKRERSNSPVATRVLFKVRVWFNYSSTLFTCVRYFCFFCSEFGVFIQRAKL